MPAHYRSSPLAAYVAASIGLLIIYACLHPFAGWRDPGLPVFEFLTAACLRCVVWPNRSMDLWQRAL